jgi:hypothetical protein
LGFEPALTHHTAKITPIVTLDEIVEFEKDVVGE